MAQNQLPEESVAAFEQLLTGEYTTDSITGSINVPLMKKTVMEHEKPFRAANLAAFMDTDTSRVNGYLDKWEKAGLLCKVKAGSGNLWIVRDLLSEDAQARYEQMKEEARKAKASPFL